MRVLIESCVFGEIQAGELWSGSPNIGPIEEQLGYVVFLRTEAPCPEHRANEKVYRVTVESE